MLGQTQRRVADETLYGYDAKISEESILGERERKSSFLMESNQL